jgi:glycosyltransferase involved in cell wall biosynthesis
VLLRDPDPGPGSPRLQRILIITDAWAPQVNGVVRTLRTVTDELRAMGATVEVVGPDRFRTIPCPSYPEIRLAILPGRKLGRIIDGFAPDALHIATEGPLGLAAQRHAKRRGLAFTTAFHTRFPEYLAARIRIPVGLTYAWLRRFHGRGSGCMVAAKSLRAELAARGFRNLKPWSRGVDLAAFQPQPREAWDFPRPIFAYVGRVAVEKNLRAFLELDLPGSKLVVGDGPQRKSLEREYPEAHFVGARFGAALSAAYAGTDALVFPSRTDTFGLVVLEALAAGVPVAAYNVTGPKDILAEADPPVGALSDDLREAALAALSVDRSACRAHAERYSWRACAQLFLDNLVPARRPQAQRENVAMAADRRLIIPD